MLEWPAQLKLVYGTSKCIEQGILTGHELFDAVVMPVLLTESGEYGYLTCYEHFESYTRFIQDTYLSRSPTVDECRITIVLPLRSIYPPLLSEWRSWCRSRSGFPRHHMLTISHLRYKNQSFPHGAACAALADMPSSQLVFATTFTIFAAVTPWESCPAKTLGQQPPMPGDYKQLSLLEYTASPVKGAAIAASQIGFHKIWFTHLA